MNKIIIVGNLTRDPEMRKTNGGVDVCNFHVAVNRRYYNKETGEQETDFFNVVAWRQLAELCNRYLAKGKKVGVSGNVQTRRYEDNNGVKRVAFDIVAEEVEFLSSYGRETNTNAAPAQAQAEPARADSDEDGELPF